MPRLLLASLFALLALPLSSWAHPGGHGGPSGFGGFGSTDRDGTDWETQTVLPDQIRAFDIVLFSRSHHRVLHYQIDNNIGDARIDGMSDALALKATAAGQVASRAVGSLFFKMWKAETLRDRTATLAAEAAALKAQEATYLAAAAGTDKAARAAQKKLRTTRLMLAFVTAWQVDPMDGR